MKGDNCHMATGAKFFSRQDGERRRISIELRKLIFRVVPNVEELEKWGIPTYVVRGKNVCSIMVHKKNVNLAFFQGSRLKSKSLQGSGKSMRHISFRSLHDIDNEEIERVLTNALKLIDTP